MRHAGPWMVQLNSPCVQAKAMEIVSRSCGSIEVAATVIDIANNRMIKVLEMSPDLVGPAGSRLSQDDARFARRSRSLSEAFELCLRVNTSLARCFRDRVVEYT